MIGRDYKWYALYVSRHHEKKVFERTLGIGVEALLPMRNVTRMWSDRIKVNEEPTFPSYLFVRTSCREYFDILNHPSVVRYVSFGGNPAEIPESQVHAIRTLHDQAIDYEVVKEQLEPGQRVIVSEGPLMGTIGELVIYGSKKRVIIRVESIGYSLMVSVPHQKIMKTHESICI